MDSWDVAYSRRIDPHRFFLNFNFFDDGSLRKNMEVGREGLQPSRDKPIQTDKLRKLAPLNTYNDTRE